MSRKVKCPECDAINDKEVTVYHNGRHYCTVCYENKKRLSEDYKALIEYICHLYDIEAPTGWMLKQIKDFREQFGYTYRGIKSSLHYFYEIQEGNSVENSMGIGIVSFIYDEAKNYYIEKKAIKDNINGCDINSIISETKTISIKKSNIEDKCKYKEISIIDIENL